MARLRYNGLTATLGAALTSTDTTITFAAPLTSAAGAVPTISGSDTIALSILDATGAVSEIVSLTAYTSGATTGTIARAQESTTAVAHASGDAVVHSPTAADFASSGSGGDGAWTIPTLTNGWTDYGSGYATAAFRKDANGVVHLRGVVTGGTFQATIFTLPAGYRPTAEEVFATSANAAFGQINVTAAGAVKLIVGGTTGACLSGITFYTV